MATTHVPQPQTTASTTASPSDARTATIALPQFTQSVSPSPQPLASDLRHMTSNTALLTPGKPQVDSRRPTKLLTTNGVTPSGTMRKGSRSPTSIPSSPTSVHSSSSAIFERDIEHPQTLPSHVASSSASAHLHPQLTHTSQIKSLECAVPSVLTSAVELLADAPSAEDANISVIAPASGVISSRINSRSPSPTRRSFIGGLNSGNASPSPRPIVPERQASINTLSGTASGTSPSSPHLSPAQHSPPLPNYTLEPMPMSSTASSSYQPSPATIHKRLSFISYTDLLTSAPVSAVPLSSIVAPATSEPPPHIPAVLGAASEYGTSVVGEDVADWQGGEWEREGFGKGLEERLEDVLKERKDRSITAA